MKNFPALVKGSVPSKLSSFVDDRHENQSVVHPPRVYRSMLSVFDKPESNASTLQRSEFVLPPYYLRTSMNGESELKLKPENVKQFSPSSLFYAFYQMPGDVLQALSAQELNSRGWRYNPDSRVWFRQANASDGLPPQMLAGGQKHFMYFDINSWQQKEYMGVMDSSRLLGPGDYSLPSNAPSPSRTARP